MHCTLAVSTDASHAHICPLIADKMLVSEIFKISAQISLHSNVLAHLVDYFDLNRCCCSLCAWRPSFALSMSFFFSTIYVELMVALIFDFGCLHTQ
jgi:hypothetical protein